MKTFYPFIRNILSPGQISKIAGLAMLFVMALLLPGKLAAQVPSISYSGPQSYPTSIAISPLTPANIGGAVPGFGFTATATFIPANIGDDVSLAEDKLGNIYIGEGGGQVSVLPAGGSTVTVLATGFGTVWGIAVDASNNVYAADGAKVWKIPAGGGTPVGLGSFSSPVGLAIDAAGYLYVASNGGSNPGVYKMNTNGAGQTRIDNNLQGPASLAFDPSGNLLVADQGTSAVYEIAVSGAQTQVVSGISGIAVVTTDADGNIYIGARPAGIYFYSPGTGLTSIESGGVNGLLAASGFNLIYANGNLYKLSPTGGYFINPGLPAGLNINPGSGVISGTPTRVSVAANYTVTAFNSSGSGTATINIGVTPGPPPAISYSTPQTFVQGSAITALSPANTGSAVGSFGFGSPNLVTTGVTDPICMTMDKSGNMYIGESSGNVSLLPAGGSSATIFASGFGPVNSIVLDASNNVYLADGVKVWKIPAGGGTAVSLSSYSNPLGVALDAAGNVYVADDNIPDSFGTVFRMAPDGSGKFGFVIAENPTAVVFDANGAEYDLEGTSPAGELLQEVAGGFDGDVAFAPNERYLAVDGAGNVFEAGSGGINYYSPVMGGTFNISSVSAKGIMFDASNNLYYADGSNIYKMNPAGGYCISPSLPSGLSFDSNTGVIGGTPATTSPATNYTVTAFNPSGSAAATINITVNPHLPTISYNSPQLYQVGTAVALAPSSAYVSSWGYNSNITAIGTFFHALTDVVTDAAGNKYVAEFGNGQLDKIPAGGGPIVVVASGFSGPFGLAIDAAGNLYITDSGNNAVREIPAGTSTVNTIGSGFNAPAALAVDASGNVFVGDTGNGALKEIPAGNGTPVTLQTGFASIQGVTVDAAGNIYVADAGTGSNGAVYKVPPGGGSMVSLGTGFSRPSGIVVDAAGNLYVSDLNQAVITVIKPDGTQLSIGSGVVRPNGVALDASGNLYIADTGTGFVEEVKINGGYFASPLLPAGLTFNNSTGVISGTPAASTPTANYTVTGWNVTGSASATVSITVGAPIINYTSPVAYATGEAITPLAPSVSGGAVGAFGFNTAAATQLPGISDAVSLAMDKSGNLYIGEGTGNISVLPAGASTLTLLATGFPAAWSVALDASDNVFVADGAHVWKIPAGGGTAVSLGSFHSPTGLAFDAAGNIYVADNSGATGGVFKMNSDGTGQTRIDNNLPQPAYIAFDNNGDLYIGDQTAQALYEIPAGGAQKQVASGLGVIVSVKTDPSGNVYVAVQSKGIYCYSPVSGVINITSLSTNGLMTDANFNLYYAVGNVFKLRPSGGYFTSPQLPAGLSINPTSGAISGTPNAAMPATNYTVKAFDAAASGTAIVNITIGPAPAISYSTPQTFTAGTAISPLLPTSTGAAVGAPSFNATTFTVNTGVTPSTSITDATCMAMDKNGNLYIGESSGRVSVLAAGSTQATVLASGFRTFSIGSTSNEGIAVDASGNVYFADGSSLWKISSGGGTPVKLNSFDAPHQVSIDASGSLYVGDFAQGIYKMATDGTNKTHILSVSVNTMAVDQNGNVFFSSRGSLNKLLEIPAGGTQITVNPNPVRTCATDPSGNAYMVNTDLSITMVPANGTAASQVESTITGLTNIMIGPDFNLYAVVSGGIVKTNFSGGYFISPELPPGLTIDPASGAISGTPAAASPATNYTVTAYSGSVGAAAAINITVNPSTPTLSYATPQVFVQNTAISPLVPVSTNVTSPGYINMATTVGSFTQPFAIAVDQSGNVYVADKSANNIYELQAGGGQVTVGTGLNTPAAVAVDKSGNIYSANQGDNTVTEIQAHSGTQTFIGSGYQRPTAVAVDSAGNVFVADVQGAAGVVYKVRAGHNKVLFKGGFVSPNGIAVDATGNVYVSDFGGGATASMVYKISSDGSTITAINHSFTTATGLAIDATGNLFIVDGGNLNILEYPAGGGAPITITAGLAFPFGLSADGAGNLYVADPGASKVVKLTPAGGYFINRVLPAGLSLNAASGTVGGAPASVSPSTNYMITAYNAGGSATATVNIKTVPLTAGLSSLVLSAGVKSPGFTTANTSYTATVGFGTSSITVTPTAIDPGATILVDGSDAVTSGAASSPIALAVGPNAITVKVSAPGGGSAETYTVTLTRTGSPNALLSGLVLSAGVKSPVFSSSVTGYTASVGHGVSAITVKPTTTDPNATVKVDGTTVTSGTASGPISLSIGPNTILVQVTAQDGSTTKTYTVTVTRAGAPDALLALLKLSAGTKVPVFGSSTFSYTEDVSHGVSSITVTPTAKDPDAMILVNNATVASGGTSDPLPLSVGPNTITIVVTATDGATQKTYTVTVTRAAASSAELNTVFEPTAVSKPTETAILADDGIKVHEGVSPNGDGINDFLQIDNIGHYPDNKLSIMNRNGQLIYQASAYDNSSKVFDGHSNKNGQMQLPGTYFYQLDYTVSGITKHKTGFIVLKY